MPIFISAYLAALKGRTMSDFTPIETQEAFDKAIGERLKRERETVESKYANYAELSKTNKDLQKQLTDLLQSMEATNAGLKERDAEIEKLNAQVSAFEKSAMKTRIAHELGLPYELAGRIQGDDEKAMRADAQSLAGYVSKPTALPMKDSEPKPRSGLDAAYASLARKLNLGE